MEDVQSQPKLWQIMLRRTKLS